MKLERLINTPNGTTFVKLEGILDEDYTSHLIDLIETLVHTANKRMPQWNQIRLDAVSKLDGTHVGSYAYGDKVEFIDNEWFPKDECIATAFLHWINIQDYTVDPSTFGIIRDEPNNVSGDTHMNYKIVGNEYTSPDFNADEFAREMIELCEKSGFQWEQIRMDRDGCVNAFTQSVGVSTGNVLWLCEKGDLQYLTCLDGDEVSWQDFGIIRHEQEFNPEPKAIKLPEHNKFHFPEQQVDPYLQGWHDAMSALDDAVDIAPIKSEDAVEFIRGYMEGQRRNIQLRGRQ